MKFDISKNPYTLQFSYIPPKLIERSLITSEIMENFLRDVPTYRGMFITGVRGSGKTVLMGNIRNRIGAMKDWITIDLNPESDMLESLARELYMIPQIKVLFVKAKMDFSVLGIGVHIENAELIASSAEDALKMMLRVLKKAGKKLLVTIDEVTYSKDMALFSHALSSYASADFDIYLLMTGLLENIKNIRNKKSLTFLYRAKVKELDNLNITAVAGDYQETLELSREEAEYLAYETKGYSLAFQALGHQLWDMLSKKGSYNKVDKSALMNALYSTLSELAYDKIWDELSATDKKVLMEIVKIISETDSGSVQVDEIKKRLNMPSDTFTKYRSRLIDAGILNGAEYGVLRIKLPQFDRYVKDTGRMVL